MTQPSFPKRRKPRTDAASLLEFPYEIRECIRNNVTQMKNVRETRLTDFKDHMKQANLLLAICWI